LTHEAAPLGVYVHWPYCARICPYCDFNVRRDRGQGEEQAALARAMVADLKRHADIIGPRRLVSVYLGGGTPSLMRPDWAAEIIAAARSLWPAAEAPEVTLEANPTDAEAGRFEAFHQAGAERLSLGVQALDDASLSFLGRNHSAAEALAALATAGRIFPRLSLDLIYARPGQEVAAWREELSRAAGLGAEHISPYQLTIEAGTAFDRMIRRGTFVPVDAEHGADLFDVTQEVLSAAGFEAYEVSNHARGLAARSRHNLVYWRGEDYVGVGPGAHGRLTLDGARTATVAEAKVEAYVRAVGETGVGWTSRQPLTPVEAAEERLLMGLRTLEGVGLAELAPIGLGPETAQLADMAQAGLVSLEGGRITATARGRLVLDRVTAELATAAPLAAGASVR
jgi:putative oxygen-independent coproporphyrinogen III oxidase